MNTPLPIEFRLMLAKTFATMMAEETGTEIGSQLRFAAGAAWHYEPTDSRADMKSLVSWR